MINGQIIIQGAQFQVLDVEGRKADEIVPMKVIEIKDLNSDLTIHLPFSHPEFEVFVDALNQTVSKIIKPGFGKHVIG